MRTLLTTTDLVCLIGITSPALSAGDGAMQAARKACKTHFGGTSDLASIDKEHRFIICRGQKARETERLPFNSGQAGMAPPTKDISARPTTTQPIITEPPLNEEVCQGCATKTNSEKLSPQNTPTSHEPVQVQQVAPIPEKGVTPSAALSNLPVSDASAKQDFQKPDNSALLAEARNICIKKYGSAAEVDHIDDKTWEVVCKKP